LSVASELERRERTVSFVGSIEAPFAALDQTCSRERILHGLINEIVESVSDEHSSVRDQTEEEHREQTLELARELMDTHGVEQQLDAISAWLAKRGIALAKEQKGLSGLREIFRRMIHHTHILSQGRIEPVKAPVWSWRADQSQITSHGELESLIPRITSGSFTHALIKGRHFDVMNKPLVGSLAVQFNAALEQSSR